MENTGELPEEKRINTRSRLRTYSGNIFHKFFLWTDYFNHKYMHADFFTFNGNTYNYFVHIYNTTWKCERTVEIPIILKLFYQRRNGNILEIGNVLSHYSDFKHDIVDKYEKAVGVINIDVLNFEPEKKYDLIVQRL